METLFLGIVIFLFVLAAFDLYVGVSNDAVNFLNSAIGSKSAKYRTIVWVAAVGVFTGCVLSNGMMDIARHGIFHPGQFSFEEVMIIYVAVMVTDIVLLDIFNSFGMPTSTTVSMVFELLGAAFAFTMIKLMGDDALAFGDYLNSDKAIQVILGVFLSVPLAFTFGVVVQSLARVIFTFNYKSRMRYFIGLFGGVAITSILYFMLFKGMKDLSVMTPDVKAAMSDRLGVILVGCFVAFSAICQLLHWVGVNVFKVIVLIGTLSLATAFAGNDLVNFIGVPLAGMSAYLDFSANGGGDFSGFMMTGLKESAQTPFYFLFGAGAIMVVALLTSKKAQRVTKTEVGLSSKQEGEELFGSSVAARSIVRFSTRVIGSVSAATPEPVKQWVNGRFAPVSEDPQYAGAAYDLVRASVNLCMASLLIALGTSLKLPLSTTFVTFMVAMGTSLADRAWTRESAVFRITGVLSVIGGWFMTAGAAFGACFVVACAMYFGGMPVTFGLILLALALVVHSQIRFGKKQAEEKQGDTLFQTIMACDDPAAVNTMLSKHLTVSVAEQLDYFGGALTKSTDGLFSETRRQLRRVERDLESTKRELKNLRRRETLCLRRADNFVGTRLSTPFHLVHNNLRQMLSGLMRINDPALEHVENNFVPVEVRYAERFCAIRDKFVAEISEITADMRADRRSTINTHKQRCEALREEFRVFRHEVLDAVQNSQNAVNLTTANLLLHIIQESEQLVKEVRSAINNLRRYYEVM
ncbi:inorganic phosphate transporter [Alloprevotella sp. OH1205_COT-284]|uniref:inorganic phosphate transporter n=1 Tax=Alloprevotella sp. OH1205_COT-284 TaxID=2491043 RepID=UPI000F5D556F|nr:inorganic phosphate transporter [Alloprevotella sp. OH1205_COT-284]RRD80209.1 inorganic phosphate transporter [Alloprevotella sp. OH1205_COT-284]